MIHLPKVAKYIEVGDTVFIKRGGAILEAPVTSKGIVGFSTKNGSYLYNDHRKSFWLTRRVAEEQTLNINKGKRHGTYERKTN